MKKILTAILALALAVSLTGVIVVSAKNLHDPGYDTTGSSSTYATGNAMEVYERFRNNDASLYKENLFDSSHKWIEANGAIKLNQTAGTATLSLVEASGHVLKNNKYGYGTFVMTFQASVVKSAMTSMFTTAAGKSVRQSFWGIEFYNTSAVGTSYENLALPWTSAAGYPYVLWVHAGVGLDDKGQSTVGTDGQATLPDGTLIADAIAADPDGEYGKAYQHGLTLSRYRSAGSHDYYCWCTTNPANAKWQSTNGNDMYSIVPDYYRSVRMEDCYDDNEHTLICQFLPLYVDNSDGIDAMMIDVWMSGLTAKPGDETQDVGGKTFTHVLRVYDEMPFDDIDNDDTIVDKRAADGAIVLWTHDGGVKSAGDANAEIEVKEFYILDAGTYKDKDGSTFSVLSAPDFKADSGATYQKGKQYSFTVGAMPETMDVIFYDSEGNKISQGKSNVPQYEEAGEYEVTARFIQPGYKSKSITRSLTINKATTFLNAETTQEFNYDGTAHEITLTVQNKRGTVGSNGVVSYDDLANTVVYSPSKTFTEAGTYYVSISLPETDNFKKSSNDLWVKVVVKGSGSQQGGTPVEPETQHFSDAEISAITWEGVGIDANMKAVYDGNEHCVYAANLPAGAYISNYGGTNVKVDAGTYMVTATLSKVGYADVEISKQFTIEKADLVINAEEMQTYYYCGVELKPNAFTTTGAEVDADTFLSDQGEYTVTLTAKGDQNYNDAQAKVIHVVIL